MSVTIKEVAREAGVSIATVSRVFNNSGPVGEETRRRIEDVARRLRYTPSGAARSLIMSKTYTLGVLLPDLHGEFFSEVIRGVDQTAQQHQYHILVSSSHNEKTEIEAALQAMRGRVDGLIVMSPDIDGQALKANLPDSLPAVLMNCYVDGSSFDSLNIDNFGGAYEMVRHLLGHGHRRVAIIQGAERNYDAERRLQGYRTAMAEAQAATIEVQGDFTEVSGYRAAAELLRRDPRPTAVFAANDSMAIGALSALREGGLRVPEDVAVAGFDDIPIARYVHPALSSVHVPIIELGARAATRLLEAVDQENKQRRRQDILSTRLMLRTSCGCTPAA